MDSLRQWISIPQCITNTFVKVPVCVRACIESPPAWIGTDKAYYLAHDTEEDLYFLEIHPCDHTPWSFRKKEAQE